MVYPSCVSSQENKQTLPFFPYTKGNILHALLRLTMYPIQHSFISLQKSFSFFTPVFLQIEVVDLQCFRCTVKVNIYLYTCVCIFFQILFHYRFIIFAFLYCIYIYHSLYYVSNVLLLQITPEWVTLCVCCVMFVEVPIQAPENG